MKTAIHNGIVLAQSGEIPLGGVLLEGNTITEVFSGAFTGNADRSIDAEGRYISPGFIDLHLHGGGGHDFMDGTQQAITEAAKEHMRHGTTSLVPTTLTCPDEELFSLFDCYRQAKAAMQDGPNLLGLHLEGPYFSPAQAGAQDPAYLRQPEKEHYMALLEAGKDDIVRISAAVELPGALELGDELKRRGILGAIGHSDAIYQQVEEGLAHGFTHVTHLYSGMSSLRRINAYRYLGVVESAYLLDGLSVEIIADGSHLPPELLRLILKCIPHPRISLVTDAMRGAGMPDGSTPLLGSLKNGQPTIIRNGVAFLPDGSAFAGSVCTTDRCVRTMRGVGLSMEQAVRLISQNPARVMGLADKKGAIAPGYDADICVFDSSVNISHVMVGGQITHTA